MDVQAEICRFLCEKNGWTATEDVRSFFAERHDGSARKRDINPHLYELERQGKIAKDPDSIKPRWRSVQSHSPIHVVPQGKMGKIPDPLQPPVQDPPAMGIDNAKGQLYTLFGQHAVMFDVSADMRGSFRAMARVGQLDPIPGELSLNKAGGGGGRGRGGGGGGGEREVSTPKAIQHAARVGGS